MKDINSKKQYKKESEDLNSYITRLRSLVVTCEFTDKNVEIKDQFIVSCKSDSLRIKLFREKDITLEKLLEICRCEETAKRQAKDMKRKDEHELDEEVSKVSQTNYFRYRNKPNRSNKFIEQSIQSLCFKCGDKSYRGHMQSCKALGKKCFACGGSNHLSNVCRAKKGKSAFKIYRDCNQIR